MLLNSIKFSNFSQNVSSLIKLKLSSSYEYVFYVIDIMIETIKTRNMFQFYTNFNNRMYFYYYCTFKEKYATGYYQDAYTYFEYKVLYSLSTV